jgi:multiple sugar transport system permease protein
MACFLSRENEVQAREPTVSTVPSPAKPSRSRRTLRHAVQAGGSYLYILPALIVMGAIIGYPIVKTVLTSFQSMQLQELMYGTPYVGLSNYQYVLSDPTFWNSLGVTAYFAVATIVIEMTLGLIIALVVNYNFRGRGILRAAMLIPWAIPAVVSAEMWAWMFAPANGAIDGLLSLLHITQSQPDPLGNATWAMPAVILVDVWRNTPFTALLLLAGLQLIPAEYYEAARVDGAGAWQGFVHITLPLLRSSFAVALLFRILASLQTFDIPRVLTGGGPGESTEVIGLDTYRSYFTYLDFGQGATLAVIVMLLTVVAAAFYSRRLTASLKG